MRTLRTLILSIATLAVATSVTGCKRPSAQQIVLTKDQEQQIAAAVLTAPPADLDQKLEVKFDDKLTLLGYKIEPKGKPITGGTQVTLSLFWRVDQPIAGDWKIFVHMEAPGLKRQPFDHYGVGGLYPLSQWKKGEIIRDSVTMDVPGDWPKGPTQFLIGVFDWGAWNKSQQNRRLKISNAPAGAAQSEDRLLLATLEGAGGAAGGAGAEAAPAAKEGPSYQVGQATQKPTIDGKLDEAAWASAQSVGAFKQPNGGASGETMAVDVKLLWDAENLYLGATVKDDDARNTHATNDDSQWEGDVVELFLQAAGKGDYYELQWTPAGSTFDAHFTGHRAPTWQEAAKHQTGMTSKVAVDGDVNADGADKGWTVEAAIPWKGVGLDSAPAAGAKFAANLYRIDDKGTHDFQHMASWAPVGGDFHQLNGAGSLTLVAGQPTAPSRPGVLPTGPALAPALRAAVPPATK